MLSDELEVIKSRMKLATKRAFQRIVAVPLPESVAYNPVPKLLAYHAFYANEFSASFTPSHAVKMSRLSTNAANKSPMPIATWIVALDIFCRLTQKVAAIRRVD